MANQSTGAAARTSPIATNRPASVYLPHVIEPSAGADRATLAFLCEAYTEDTAPDDKGKMQTRVVMKFHPRTRSDQGGRFSAGEKRWHAGDGPRDLPDALKEQVPRLLRRKGGRRPSLSPPGRGRHALLRHRRRADAHRPDRHRPRPRHARAVASEDRRCGRGDFGSSELVRRVDKTIPPAARRVGRSARGGWRPTDADWPPG